MERCSSYLWEMERSSSDLRERDYGRRCITYRRTRASVLSRELAACGGGFLLVCLVAAPQSPLTSSSIGIITKHLLLPSFHQDRPLHLPTHSYQNANLAFIVHLGREVLWLEVER